MRIKSHLIFAFLFILFLSSCGENSIYQDNRNLVEGKWASNELLDFEINISDTSQKYHLVYIIRNSINYPYYNLYLKYKLKDSIGSTLSENLQELILMDKKTGKPFGSGFGEMYDHQFVSLRDFQFKSAGIYHFQVQHYMRHDTLSEVYSIGLKVIESD